MDSPNPLAVAFSISRALLTVKPPKFGSEHGPDHHLLGGVLDDLARHGMKALGSRRADLAAYLAEMESMSPSTLNRDASLAYWMNVYNAGALSLAGAAAMQEVPSVLRIPGGFSSSFVTIDGVQLSLDAIEHAKIRRFKDPRIHGALVCGSVSCPTLRATPYLGVGLQAQLDEQMRTFLAGGAAAYDPGTNILHLSRVFRWYGGDFARPARMPTFLPARQSQLLNALEPWIAGDVPGDATVAFQSYDWGLRCAVG